MRTKEMCLVRREGLLAVLIHGFSLASAVALHRILIESLEVVHPWPIILHFSFDLGDDRWFSEMRNKGGDQPWACN